MIARSLRRLRRHDRGQALVEFALVAPILLILILGIVDFARAWNVYQVLTDAGREGTRNSVVDNGSTVAETQNLIINAANRAGIQLSPSNITVQVGTNSGDATTVTINYTHRLNFIGGAFRIFTGSPNINFSVVSTMRRE
jgi:Flp pilus assembly protein TadG